MKKYVQRKVGLIGTLLLMQLSTGTLNIYKSSNETEKKMFSIKILQEKTSFIICKPKKENGKISHGDKLFLLYYILQRFCNNLLPSVPLIEK